LAASTGFARTANTRRVCEIIMGNSPGSKTVYRCKACGGEIEDAPVGALKKRYNYCLDCNDEIALKRSQLMRFGRKIEIRLKAAADASGNPKVWTADKYSQEELRKLIPR
jgi:hypothetical protein